MKNYLRFFISSLGNLDFSLTPVISICKRGYPASISFLSSVKARGLNWTWTMNSEPRIKRRCSSLVEKKEYEELSRYWHFNNSLLLSRSIVAPSFLLLIILEKKIGFPNNACEILRWWCYAFKVTSRITSRIKSSSRITSSRDFYLVVLRWT